MSLVPGPADLWFLPLGGTGEIGMNMNLFGHDGEWLMVDCGVTFDEPLTADSHRSHPIVSADPKFIVDQRERLKAIIITHAHEDHLGALPYLWVRLKAPVYATPFAAEVLRRKLRQHGLLNRVPINEIPPGGRFNVGGFNLEFLPITHSIPEPQALLISTAAGTLFHTADWKIDPKPVIGEPFDRAQFESLAQRNVRAMLCDSTNALKTGASLSESICHNGLLRQIEKFEGRVVVSCFSSNLARLVTIARVAKQTGRYFALIGRSLQNMYTIARQTGYWPADLEAIDPSHLGFLPRNEVLAVATGSQGEPRSALSRLAQEQFDPLQLEAGDRVVMSSFLIPGNERLVERMVESLRARKIEVIESAHSSTPIHASGHPCQAELADMYEMVQPDIAVPLHGEPEHMHANASIAKRFSVPIQLTGLNGDLFELAPGARVHFGAVKTGRIPLVER